MTPSREMLLRLEGFIDQLCNDSHREFLENREPYQKGRADALTEILEFMEEMKKDYLCRNIS